MTAASLRIMFSLCCKLLAQSRTCTQPQHMAGHHGCIAVVSLLCMLLHSRLDNVHAGSGLLISIQGSICTELVRRLSEHAAPLARAVATAAEVSCRCCSSFRLLPRALVLRLG